MEFLKEKRVFDSKGRIEYAIIEDKEEIQRILEDKNKKFKIIEIKDKYGKIEYLKIPNYKENEKFITEVEFIFYKQLKKAVKIVNRKYKKNLTIFSQIALNRLIDVNNKKEERGLLNRIKEKSIDFALYDEDTRKIFCCIELDDETHIRMPQRMERDLFVNKALADNIKLIHIRRADEYSIHDIIEKILL